MQSIKLTIVGDGAVGKTSLLFTYVSDYFPEEYVPTVFDVYSHYTIVDGLPYNVGLWDTAGQEDYARLRPLSYTKTDCFLMCCSVADQMSYENVLCKWHPEVRKHCPEVPIVLLATKTDLREGPSIGASTKKGKILKHKIKAARYMECSAKRMQGVKEVFEEAVRAVTEKPSDKGNCAVV